MRMDGTAYPILRMFDRTVALFWALWTGLTVLAPGEITGRWIWVAGGVVLLAAAWSLESLLRFAGEKTALAVRTVFATIAIFGAFTLLGFVIPAWADRTFEPELIAIDRWMFGVDPTVWFDRFSHPILTEALQLVYSTFYFLPFLLGAFLWRERRWRDLSVVLLAVTLGFYLSYFGYLLVPARSPVYPLHEGQPLPGLWLAEWLWRTLSTLEANKLDAFPSGHTEVTLVLMVLARRLSPRGAYPILLGLGSSLIFSTVYLRYHYVIDVVAGAALAVLVLWLTHRLTGRSAHRSSAQAERDAEKENEEERKPLVGV